VNGVSAVVGTGTTNYLPKFTGASTIGDSIIQESSSNIGIGVSPSYKLDVNGIGQFRDDIRFSTTNSSIGYTDALRFVQLGVDTRLTLSGGNLGLGVTPSAWTTSSGRRAIEVGALGNALFGAGSSDIRVLSNVYVNTSNQRTYANNGLAGEYQIGDGVHIWYTAPSGTANCAISFTQAMTLNACGRLSIGTTTTDGFVNVWSKSNDVAQFIGYAGTSIQVPAFGFWATNINSNTGGLEIRTSNNGVFSNALSLAPAGAATFNSSVIVNNATTDAASALQVKVLAANATSARITSTTNNNLFSFISNGAAGHAILDMGRCTESGTFAAGFIRLRTDGDSWIQGGNVGIGTASPAARLHVQSPNNVIGRIIIKGGKDDVLSVGEINSQLDFGSNDASVGNDDNIGGRIASVTEFSNGAFTGMAFYTYQQGRSPDLKEAVRITNAGNVGIGTNSPTSFLEVCNPSESSTATISWQNGGRIRGSLYSDTGGIAMHIASDFNSAAIYMVPNDQIQFRIGNATPRLLLTNEGCVACFAGTVCAANFIAASSGTVQACRIYTGTSDITVNNGTFTTIFSSTGNGGVWLVSFALNGNPSQVGYAIVGNAFGSSITLLAASSGSQTCLTSSGLNLQLCQTSGANLTARVSNILLTSILA
jgi:hypothetical protein